MLYIHSKLVVVRDPIHGEFRASGLDSLFDNSLVICAQKSRIPITPRKGEEVPMSRFVLSLWFVLVFIGCASQQKKPPQTLGEAGYKLGKLDETPQPVFEGAPEGIPLTPLLFVKDAEGVFVETDVVLIDGTTHSVLYVEGIWRKQAFLVSDALRAMFVLNPEAAEVIHWADKDVSVTPFMIHIPSGALAPAGRYDASIGQGCTEPSHEHKGRPARDFTIIVEGRAPGSVDGDSAPDPTGGGN